MPSLRNRKVKGRVEAMGDRSSVDWIANKLTRIIYPTEERVVGRRVIRDARQLHTRGLSDLEDIADICKDWLGVDYRCTTDHDFNGIAYKHKPTIDEYVKRCFGCAKPTTGKYCGVMCNPIEVDKIRAMQAEKREMQRWKDECCERINGNISLWLLEAIANDLGISTA